jgi:hypothetical protein
VEPGESLGTCSASQRKFDYKIQTKEAQLSRRSDLLWGEAAAGKPSLSRNLWGTFPDSLALLSECFGILENLEEPLRKPCGKFDMDSVIVLVSC